MYGDLLSLLPSRPEGRAARGPVLAHESGEDVPVLSQPQPLHDSPSTQTEAEQNRLLKVGALKAGATADVVSTLEEEGLGVGGFVRIRGERHHSSASAYRVRRLTTWLTRRRRAAAHPRWLGAQQAPDLGPISAKISA